MNKVTESSLFIKNRIGSVMPKITLILGSGLGYFIENLKIFEKISYQDIPGFPIATAPGHEGYLVFGYYNKIPIVVMQGRFHYYEGYTMKEITFPIRVLKKIGIETLIVTNASGGINLNYSAGDLVIIKDHINYSGINPLVGKSFNDKNRFIDMTYTYDLDYRKKIKAILETNGLTYREAVYLYTTGPSYETPSEINAFRVMGADCVGMSTVPEVITARDEEMKILGISCISNMAAGILETELNEEEVLKITDSVKIKFSKLIGKFIISIS